MKLQFREHLPTVLVFSAVVLSLLMVARVVNLLVFGDWLQIQDGLPFLSDLIFKGFRFDLKIVSVLLLVLYWLPALFLSHFCQQNTFRHYLQIAFKVTLVVVVFFIFVDLGFHYYYQKPIDVLIFALFDDDTLAIVKTFWNNPFLMAVLVVFFMSAFVLWGALGKLFNKYSKPGKLELHRVNTPVFAIVSFLLFATLARGSWFSYPLQRNNASVSDNEFINSMVMNSAFNLYYAWFDHQENSQGVFKTDILKTHELKSFESLVEAAGYNQDFPLQTRTPKNKQLEAVKPHVIFVLMEGWAGQIAAKNSPENQVLGEFAQHAKADYFNTRIFCNRDETNPSIEDILMNSPITPIAQSLGNKTSFSMSNVLPYKNKGYKTQFLSGGYSSWRNHNNFWLRQGFDRYIGRSRIETAYQVDASDNPWGVYDEYVFKYLEKTIEEAEQANESLFSFVLTTNNHPPIRLPKDFKAPPLSPAAYGFDDNDSYKRMLLTGYNYQTEQLGRFISWVKNSPYKDRVVIVATGDHPLRKFFDNSAIADQYRKYTVPAYFYVPESLGGPQQIQPVTAGSHANLFPTLFELTLSDASYFQFGQSLLQQPKLAPYGWNNAGVYLFDSGIAFQSNQQLYPFENPDKIKLSTSVESLSPLEQSIISQEEHRKWLKQYLLVKDYRDGLQQNKAP